jgi:hypothetical protein
MDGGSIPPASTQSDAFVMRGSTPGFALSQLGGGLEFTTASDSEKAFLAKPDLKRPEWGAQNGARSASITGYAGRVGDRAAIEPAGGDSPLRGGAEVVDG